MNPSSGYKQKLQVLARNLWWTWSPEVTGLFRALDPGIWRRCNHNLLRFLQEIPAWEVDSRANELDLEGRINFARRRLEELLRFEDTWGWTHAGLLRTRPVAYFSAEFGLHESIPVYSGGLGVLAGDHIKTSSDLGLPLVGIGLLYLHGYFKQRLDSEGWQAEEYGQTDLSTLPLTKICDEDGKPLLVRVGCSPRPLHIAVWVAEVGQSKLLLLDTNVEENDPEDRTLTNRLYGGDRSTRIRQEMILGIGGVRALRLLDIDPGVYHLNEGHCAFAPLEAMRQMMDEHGSTMPEALRQVSMKTVFTTHTPVEAGHDRFEPWLLEEQLSWMADDLAIPMNELLALGRVNPHDRSEPFCMTVLALKLSRHANAVSALHGHTARKMWNNLWPDREEQDVPIGHITNGVHVLSWMAPTMYRLYERFAGKDFHKRLAEREAWEGIASVDDKELWEAHTLLRRRLIAYVRRRLAAQAGRRGEKDAEERARNALDADRLTIGFARRFATYKRATLIFRDLERLADLMTREGRELQLVMAGKAHPADNGGKRLIQQIHEVMEDPRFQGHLIFVEDYDIGVGRHLVQGVDVWLNNPLRPLEASGTSGQKVVLNGGLNFSVLDGWWAEAYDGTNGFAIGNGYVHKDPDIQEERDAEDLYRVLEEQIVPLFYDVDEEGVPRAWVQRMKRAILTLAWRFSSTRMLIDYVREAYLPAAGAVSCEMD